MQAETLPNERVSPLPWMLFRHSTALPWLLVALGAALLRLLVLDRVPLSEAEASYAFPVWQAAQGQLDDTLVALGAPLFTNLVTLTIWLFGASDFAARLVPAFAGVALAMTPALLVAIIGTRAALAASVLIATSPITVELSRQVDPAVLSAALVAVAVASAIRLVVDRPPWAPWLLAASVGLGLACHSGFVIGAGAALLAAYATWGQLPRLSAAQDRRDAVGDPRPGAGPDDPELPALVTWAREHFGAWLGPLALGGGLALVAATGLLMDLAGVGFMFGGLWGGALQSLAPAGLLSRYLGVFLAYGALLVVLATVGFVLAIRSGDRNAAFLGQWALLLIVLSAGFGALGNAGPALYIVPLAILGGIAVARAVPWRAIGEVTGAGWAAIAVSSSLLVVVLLILVALVAGSRSVPIIGWIGLVAGVLFAGWLWARALEPARRGASAITLAAMVFLALTAAGVLRLSFGGSPKAAEPLAPVQTYVAFRDAFQDLETLVRREPERVMIYDSTTPIVARWYGRNLQQMADRANVPAGSIRFRTAPPPQTRFTPGDPWRVPLQAVGQLDPDGLNPAGVVRWVATRTGLVQVRSQDIIIVR